MAIRILIADDYPLIGEGLCKLLSEKIENVNIEIVESFTSGTVFLAQTSFSCLDVVLLSYELADLGTAALVKKIQSLNMKVNVVVYHAPDDLETAVTLLAAGATAYIAKDESTTQIVAAVRTVLQNKQWLTPTLGAEAIKQLAKATTELPVLKERERLVLLLLAQGVNNKEIAARLSLADQTIKNIVSNLYDIFEVESRGQLVLRARELETVLRLSK